MSEIEGRPFWLVNDRLSGARTPHVRSFRLAQEMVTVTPTPLGQFSKSAMAYMRVVVAPEAFLFGMMQHVATT